MATLRELVLARAGDSHPGLLFEGSQWSWDEVVDEAQQRASLALSLRVDDAPFHIGVLLDNVPEFLFWILGSALAGATIVGVNSTRRGQELAADIRHTDCQLLVTDESHATLLVGLPTEVPASHLLLVDSNEYRDLVAKAPVQGDPVRVLPADLAMLLFTSGSTAAPKAVIVSAVRLARIAGAAADAYAITRQDICYNAMPLFHGNAIMANIAPALVVGATIVLRRRFSASGFISDVRRYGVTYFTYVGRALAYILAAPPTAEDRDNRLRMGFGTEATELDRANFTRRFGCPLVESYGSSEGGISIAVTPETPRGSLGLPRASIAMDVIVADSATSTECPRALFDAEGRLLNAAEAIGELVNRAGSPMFEGYYANESAEAERRRDGWYWSGDLGYRDEAGFFYFAGRGNDWLRVDGENFAAAPIERILARHPGVAVAAVYAVPDPRTGDRVMAALELVPHATFDAATFGEFLGRQPDLGTKWAPTFVRLIDAMPVTASNKVAKSGLRSVGWRTSDPVYWNAGPGDGYCLMTPADSTSLERQFTAYGRAQLSGSG